MLFKTFFLGEGGKDLHANTKAHHDTAKACRKQGAHTGTGENPRKEPYTAHVTEYCVVD
jgi:hypothetical protein